MWLNATPSGIPRQAAKRRRRVPGRLKVGGESQHDGPWQGHLAEMPAPRSAAPSAEHSDAWPRSVSPLNGARSPRRGDPTSPTYNHTPRSRSRVERRTSKFFLCQSPGHSVFDVRCSMFGVQSLDCPSCYGRFNPITRITRSMMNSSTMVASRIIIQRLVWSCFSSW
jgi:hypothetical protein